MTAEEQEEEARKLQDAIAQLNRWEESVTMAAVDYWAHLIILNITSHHITSHHITSHHTTPHHITSHHITSS